MSVRMWHPSLPSGQTITVATVSVPRRQATGWQVAEDPTTSPTSVPADPQNSPAGDGGDIAKAATPRRSRATHKEES